MKLLKPTYKKNVMPILSSRRWNCYFTIKTARPSQSRVDGVNPGHPIVKDELFLTPPKIL